MSKYLIQGSYVGKGVEGLMKEGGSARQEAAAAAIASVGGTVDCFYYAFGDTDVVAIADFPDEASAVAMSLIVNASGAVELSLTRLLETEVLDEAASKTPSYRPPGS